MDAAAEQVATTPGRILAAERERQGLGPADIAQRLHMSVSQVEALEADDYAKLPRGTFLRGFVRNYAKTLGLAPEDVLARLAEGAPREPAPRIVVPSQNIRFDAERMTPYMQAGAIAAVVLVIGFAAMYWWLFIRNAPLAHTAAKKPETVAAAPAPAAAVPLPPRVQQPAPEPVKAEVPKPEPPKAEPPKAEPPKPEPPKAEPPKVAAKPASGDVTLKFRFKGKSWVEVKDAGGRVLLTGLNDAGSDAAITGRPPLRIVVGNAPDVQMFFNEREFDLSPHMRDAVARVTVE